MEKPVTLTIQDSQGEIVYMKFIDANQMDTYIETLDRMADDFVEVKVEDSGGVVYSMPEYIQKLLRGTK